MNPRSIRPNEERNTPRPAARRPIDLARLSDDELACRFCELPIRLEGTPVAARARRVFDELRARDLLCEPAIWLAEEWFNPDATVGFAIPFYLAHPRLIRLERKLMLEAEGVAESECLRILRHDRTRRRRGLSALPHARVPAGVRLAAPGLPHELRGPPRQPRLRHPPQRLVRAVPPRRGLRRDVRGMAEARWVLAPALPRLAGAAQAHRRRRMDAGSCGPAPDPGEPPPGGVAGAQHAHAGAALRGEAPLLRHRRHDGV